MNGGEAENRAAVTGLLSEREKCQETARGPGRNRPCGLHSPGVTNLDVHLRESTQQVLAGKGHAMISILTNGCHYMKISRKEATAMKRCNSYLNMADASSNFRVSKPKSWRKETYSVFTS